MGYSNMKLFLLLTTLAAVALADPYYYGYYGHQLQWPGVRAPGLSSTCWGCRGKDPPMLSLKQNPKPKLSPITDMAITDTVTAFPDIAMLALAATAIPMLTITSANDQLIPNLITDITDTDITHTLTDSDPVLLVILLALLILTEAHKVLANDQPRKRLLPNTLMVSTPVAANHM